MKISFKEAELRVKNAILELEATLPNPTPFEIALFVYAVGLDDGLKGDTIDDTIANILTTEE